MDYQLLGESVPDILSSIEKTKFYEPYVIWFKDWSKLITNWKEKDFTPKLELVPQIEHLSMASSIPYLQFPWLEGGNYGRKNVDVWREWMKAQKKKDYFILWEPVLSVVTIDISNIWIFIDR